MVEKKKKNYKVVNMDQVIQIIELEIKKVHQIFF